MHVLLIRNVNVCMIVIKQMLIQTRISTNCMSTEQIAVSKTTRLMTWKILLVAARENILKTFVTFLVARNRIMNHKVHHLIDLFDSVLTELEAMCAKPFRAPKSF